MEVKSFDFAAAWQELKRFEDANGQNSAEFYAAYTRGDVQPTPIVMRWASAYEVFLELAPPVTEPLEDRGERLVTA